MRITVSYDSPATYPQAVSLAERLQLPMADLGASGEAGSAPLFTLRYSADRLALIQLIPAGTGPVFADFIGGPLARRRREGGGHRQPLARAAGLKNNHRPTIFDLTGGLGRDAFLFASWGCQVHLWERSPIVGALLEDALTRASEVEEVRAIVRDNLHFHPGDGLAYLEANRAIARPEVIYLDPMFPHRTKSALVKKEMRLLREVVGDDPDAPDLLAAALAQAQKRVIVKRPRLAPPLAGPKPTLAIDGKQNRFDLYLSKEPTQPSQEGF